MGGRMAGIEGPNLLEEALRAGVRVACVFAAQDAEGMLDELALARETEILLMPRELLESALTTESPQPIAALIEPPDWTWGHLLGSRGKSAPLLLVLAGIEDPGNLGTILRSAEAFGAHGVLALPGTVSAWNPKTVRASAGSVFRLPLLATSEAEAFIHLREAGIKSGLPPCTEPSLPTWWTWRGRLRSSSGMRATESPRIWQPRRTAH